MAARIPRGRVATYGQIARLAGMPGQARLVGYALAALEDRSRIPWHRVINAKGRVSLRSDGGMDVVQRLRLEREGVRFDRQGSIDLARFRWRPRAVESSVRGRKIGMKGRPTIARRGSKLF